jgi:hypothetical protein
MAYQPFKSSRSGSGLSQNVITAAEKRLKRMNSHLSVEQENEPLIEYENKDSS